MKRIISFIAVFAMCLSLFGGSAYAGLDMSAWENFKQQAQGKTTPTPAPASSAGSDLQQRLDDLARQVQSGEAGTDAVSSASKDAASGADSYNGPGLDNFKAFKDKHNADAEGSAAQSKAHNYGPSESDLIAIGFDGQIKMPHEAYYLDDYEYAFIFDPSYGLNVRVYRNPDDGICEGNMLPNAWHGSEVTLLAKRHAFYCIIYYTNDNQICAGWVHEDNLRSNFPGDWYGRGQRNAELFEKEYYKIRPEVEWSEDYFGNSHTRYSKVWSPGGVIAMDLEYQVIGRNGKVADGGRDVFMDVGDGWVYIGSFEVNEELDPVRYTVYFNYPVTVKAVAVFPENVYSEGFDFRMCVENMYYVIE